MYLAVRDQFWSQSVSLLVLCHCTPCGPCSGSGEYYLWVIRVDVDLFGIAMLNRGLDGFCAFCAFNRLGVHTPSSERKEKETQDIKLIHYIPRILLCK